MSSDSSVSARPGWLWRGGGALARIRRDSGLPILLAAPLVLVLLFGFANPLLQVLVISVTDPRPGIGNYTALIQSAGIRQMLWNTFSVSAWTTLFAVVIGYVMAAGLKSMSNSGRSIALLMIVFSMWLSVLIRTFGWLVLLGDKGIINNWLTGSGLTARPLAIIDTPAGVLIGMVHYMVPIATLPILSALEKIDPRMGQAARSLGAGPLLRFFRVELPLVAPGLVSAGLLVFLFAIGFYIIPAILGGGRQTMIAEFISLNVLDLPRWSVATACATVLLTATLLLLLAISRIGGTDRLLGGR